MDDYQLECFNCGWQGTQDQLHCSEEDFNKEGEVSFNLCPNCESDKVEEIES